MASCHVETSITTYSISFLTVSSNFSFSTAIPPTFPEISRPLSTSPTLSEPQIFFPTNFSHSPQQISKKSLKKKCDSYLDRDCFNSDTNYRHRVSFSFRRISTGRSDDQSHAKLSSTQSIAASLNIVWTARKLADPKKKSFHL